ncbi:hypothetical protein ABG067_004363 [Albugo candida]
MLEHECVVKLWWAEAVNPAAYITNRLPNFVRAAITPTEVSSGIKPDIGVSQWNQPISILQKDYANRMLICEVKKQCKDSASYSNNQDSYSGAYKTMLQLPESIQVTHAKVSDNNIQDHANNHDMETDNILDDEGPVRMLKMKICQYHNILVGLCQAEI